MQTLETMKIGFHVSAAGGFAKVIPRAVERKCSVIQLFSRSPRRWAYKKLDPADIAAFKKQRRKANIDPVFVHMPYIINLASTDKELYKRSIDSLRVELMRSHTLGAEYVIVHAGSAEERHAGIKRMVRGVEQALNEAANSVVLLIENTPGGGTEFGDTFADLANMIQSCKYPQRIGITLDTAHAFAAGYGIDEKKGVDAMISDIDRLIGMNKLHLVHFNDSKTECGSRHDRHEHIGKGKIGKGMKYIINHPLLKTKPFILETPRMNAHDDLRNLKTVQRYLAKH